MAIAQNEISEGFSVCAFCLFVKSMRSIHAAIDHPTQPTNKQGPKQKMVLTERQQKDL